MRFHILAGPALSVAAASFVTACGGARARFEIVRPALLDASPYGNTFTVQPFDGVDRGAAYRAQAQIEQRIAHSLNPSIQLLTAGGGVIVSGTVLEHSYAEQTSSTQQTCQRTESYRDATGRTQTRSVPYPCVQIMRIGRARSAIRFSIALASTGQVIFDRVYEQADSAQTSAVDAPPPPIDGAGMLTRLLDDSVEQFARVILPWPDTVEVAFTDCGGAEGCDEAFRLVTANDLRGAEALYTRILGPYDDPALAPSEQDADIVAETLFNRGIVRAYTGSYELGLQDLERALAIRPDEESWRAEFAQIEALAEESDRLRSQIASEPAPPSP